MRALRVLTIYMNDLQDKVEEKKSKENMVVLKSGFDWQNVWKLKYGGHKVPRMKEWHQSLRKI